MQRQPRGARSSQPGTGGRSHDAVRADSAPYRALGDATTGQAAADLAAQIDGTTARDLRLRLWSLEAATGRMSSSAQAAGRAALQTARAASEAAAMKTAVAPVLHADRADRPTEEAAQQTLARSGGRVATTARLAARAALATAIASRLAELAVIEYEHSRSRGVESPDVPRSNVS